jgi:hypothetical protein
LLTQCCEALDMVQDYRVQIERDGAVIRSKGGVVKDHPLLRHEMAARAFIARCIARLGLDVEALRAGPGRPGGGIGYVP